MRLKIKILKWSAGLPVAMLNEKTAEILGVNIGDRITIKTISKPKKKLTTIVDIVTKIVKKNEIAISSEIKKIIGLRIGNSVEVELAEGPKSLIFIKKKLNKIALSENEINEIIKDVADNSLSEAEIALFISAMYKQGMSRKETVYLIKAILKTGKTLNLKSKFIVDKHSIGGIPGNRTTPIVVSICAAAGLIMPKTSSRAITSSAGTADVMETITNVDFSMDELKKIVKKTNACLTWGGALEIVPADSKIIRIEKMLKIDPKAQMLASIMAKKLAVGANYIVIDIPYGENAKVNKEKALILKKDFEYLGRIFKKKLEVMMFETNEPMGMGVGPALELIDVINVLDPKKQGPMDLEKKSLALAGKLLEMTKKAKKGKGIDYAREILNSGKAWDKFKQIVEAQGGKVRKIEPGKFRKDILSPKRGKIFKINNSKINELARVAGGPADKFAGLRIYISIGDKVKTGTKMMTIYAESKSRLNQAVNFCKDKKPIIIR